jgi:NAD(P)-dependent dehydrogenase (short-subunit alcohol dehydrogenase family)
MTKRVLITGATDGIGLETAKRLVGEGHQVIIHGRNPEKIAAAKQQLLATQSDGWVSDGWVETCQADLSRLNEVEALAKQLRARHFPLDVIINNAGIMRSPTPVTPEGLDIRFVVNTLAPYLLARQLAAGLPPKARIINLSSAAQAPVEFAALKGEKPLDDMQAYAQSKLALTMWTRALSQRKENRDVVIVAVNPGSLLASKMVKEGFGVAGKSLAIGADILVKAALSGEFTDASGRYFDNDEGRFASPHQDALDDDKCTELVAMLEALLKGV